MTRDSDRANPAQPEKHTRPCTQLIVDDCRQPSESPLSTRSGPRSRPGAGIGLLVRFRRIVANDSTGAHTLDSVTTTGPYNPMPSSSLTQLALSGHTLTWTHAGSPRSAQLN